MAAEPTLLLNLEDFINISIMDGEEQEQIQGSSTQSHELWDQAPVYPWSSNQQEYEAPQEIAVPSLFDVYTMQEEEVFVDPFADLLQSSPPVPPSVTLHEREFLEKLNQRRLKLDELARRLSVRDGEEETVCSSPANASSLLDPQSNQWGHEQYDHGLDDCKRAKSWFDGGSNPVQAYSLYGFPTYNKECNSPEEVNVSLADMVVRTSALYAISVPSSPRFLTELEKDLCSQMLPVFLSLHLL